MIHRGKVARLKRAGPHSPALLSYESLPSRERAKVDALVSNPHAAAAGNDIEALIVHDAGLSEKFMNYHDASGYLKPERQRMLYANCIVLEAVGRYVEGCRMKRSSLGKRSKMPPCSWGDIAVAVREVDRSRFPHGLPGNARRLEEKFRRYGREGWEMFIHGNRCNVHAARIDDADKWSWTVKMLSDSRNLDCEQAARLYNLMAAQKGWKTVTGATMRVWRRKYWAETYAGRRGATAFMNTVAMQVKRRAPEFPLCFWSVDGWVAELLYQKFENGCTSYHHRATIVAVLDACTKYPVGYAVGTHESPKLIRAALRDAARHTGELFGRMYRTQQIQSDRYAIGGMTPFYEGMSAYYTPAAAHNAKAKPVEPYFRYLQKEYCQMLPNWSGFGITSGKDRQPSVDALNLNKKSFPDFEGVCRQLDTVMGLERKRKGPEYVKRFEGLPAEKRLELSYDNYLLLFGETTGRRNLLQGNGITATVEGRKRQYDCFDVSFRLHRFEKWALYYDRADMTKALAVNGDGTLRYMLEEKYVQPMDLASRGEGDAAELERQRAYNEALIEHVTEVRAKSDSRVREMLKELGTKADEGDMVALPGGEDTLYKLQLTDSRGRHKDQRNGRRRGTIVEADAETEEEEGFNIRERY
jgi:hypothetical protein